MESLHFGRRRANAKPVDEAEWWEHAGITLQIEEGEAGVVTLCSFNSSFRLLWCLLVCISVASRHLVMGRDLGEAPGT